MSLHRIDIEGALTLDGATAVLTSGCSALAQLPAGDAVFDLAKVGEVDSSGLAVLFAWLRAANAGGRKLSFAGAPEQLLSLAAVYGVGDLLPLA